MMYVIITQDMYDKCEKCVWRKGEFYGDYWCLLRIDIESVFVFVGYG